MSTTLQLIDNVALFTITGQYSLGDLAQIQGFAEGKLPFQDAICTVDYIIYNCTNWQSIDSMGGELLLYKADKKLKEKTVVFCGLPEGIDFIIQSVCGELYDTAVSDGTLLLFDTYNQCVDFLREQGHIQWFVLNS